MQDIQSSSERIIFRILRVFNRAYLRIITNNFDGVSESIMYFVFNFSSHTHTHIHTHSFNIETE